MKPEQFNPLPNPERGKFGGSIAPRKKANLEDSKK